MCSITIANVSKNPEILYAFVKQNKHDSDKSGKMQSLLSDIENGSVGCALCTYNTKKKAETICAFVS